MTSQGEAPVETGGEAPAETSGRSPQRRGTAPERLLFRLIALAGVIGVGVALGAILASNKVQGWIIGLVVAVVSVALGALARRQR